VLVLPTCRFRTLFVGCSVVTSTEVHGRGVFGQRRRQIYGHDEWIHSVAEHINFWPPTEFVLRCRYQYLCCAEADGKSMALSGYSIWNLLFSNLVSDFFVFVLRHLLCRDLVCITVKLSFNSSSFYLADFSLSFSSLPFFMVSFNVLQIDSILNVLRTKKHLRELRMGLKLMANWQSETSCAHTCL